MILVRCMYCANDYSVPATLEQVEAWRRGPDLIQNALPELTSDERELLISGTCSKCWEDLFADQE